MKTLKLDHTSVTKVLSGQNSSTWRIYDDKNISVDDEVELIDKIDPHSPSTWRAFSHVLINSVIEKRIKDVSIQELAGHDPPFHDVHSLLMHYKQRYGSHITEATPIKIIHFTVKDRNEKIFDDSKTTFKRAKLYADGGSRGNPGPSASGFALIDEMDNVVVKKGMYLGVTTNNQAEYQALKFGLDEALRLGVRDIEVYMDSLLVVNQMKGLFKVKNRDLWPIHESIKAMSARFSSVSFTHIPRERNKIADGAVNQALDDALTGG